MSINNARIGFDPQLGNIVIFIPGSRPNQPRVSRIATDEAVRAVTRKLLQGEMGFPVKLESGEFILTVNRVGDVVANKEEFLAAARGVLTPEEGAQMKELIEASSLDGGKEQDLVPAEPEQPDQPVAKPRRIPFFALKKMAKEAGIDVEKVDKKEWPRLLEEKAAA